MKIEILTEESTSFGIIEGGECFGYGAINNVYLKMNNREAVQLKTGTTKIFADSETVIPLPNATVLVK